jgi:hypothetical protein
MVRHIQPGSDHFTDTAPRAVAAHRALVAAARDHRAVLADKNRIALDAALADLSDNGLFDGDVLAAADAIVAPLEAAIAWAGGAPPRRWTEEGDGYLAGGTEAAVLSNASATASASASTWPGRWPIASRPRTRWRDRAVAGPEPDDRPADRAGVGPPGRQERIARDPPATTVGGRGAAPLKDSNRAPKPGVGSIRPAHGRPRDRSTAGAAARSRPAWPDPARPRSRSKGAIGFWKTGCANPFAPPSWPPGSPSVCAAAGRLSVDQVREIRRLAKAGECEEEIRVAVGARSRQQVRGVMKGRTYNRVP